MSVLSSLLLELPDRDPFRRLPLHVLALVEMERGATLPQLNGLMSEAMDLERTAALEAVALHASHQLALLTQSRATVARVGAYYKETYETLTRMRRPEPAALCLKSMAEIYLAKGRIDGAHGLLSRAEGLLRERAPDVAAHVGSWLAALDD